MHDIAPEAQAPTVEWPNQHGGEVTHQDLAAHYSANKAAYHPLLQPVVERVLAEHDKSGALVSKPEEAEAYDKARDLLSEAIEEYREWYHSSPVPVVAFQLTLRSGAQDNISIRHVMDAVVSEYDLNPEETSTVKTGVCVDLFLSSLYGHPYVDYPKDEVLKKSAERELQLSEEETEKVHQQIRDFIESGSYDWDTQSLIENLRITKDLVERCKLDEGLLEQWHKKAPKSFLEHNYNKHVVYPMPPDIAHKELSETGMDVTERRKLAHAVYIEQLESGAAKDASIIREALLLEEKFEPEELQKAVEAGIQNWSKYADNDLNDIIWLLQTTQLTPEYLQQPHVSEPVAHGLIQRIYGYNNVAEINAIAETMHLSPGLCALIDAEGAKKIQSLGGVSMSFVNSLGSNFNTFPLMNTKALELLGSEIVKNEDTADFFLECIDKFAAEQDWLESYMLMAVGHYSVAKKFTIAYAAGPEWANQSWTTKVLAKAEKNVAEHVGHWNADDEPDMDFKISGVRDHMGAREIQSADPYEDDEWKFGPEQAKIASGLSKLLAGKPTDAAYRSLGLEPGLELANKLLNTLETMKAYLQSFDNELLVYAEKHDIAPGEIRKTGETDLTSLPVNVRGLLSRYIAQSINHERPIVEEVQRLSLDIRKVLKEGYDAYKQVLEVDVPLYDKLYEEFDDIRADGRKPMEVYLGRDGIYAWVGRKAQDAARRRKAVNEGWSRSEILEIHPKYVVYPRYFRDRMSREAQREYLEQEGVTFEADPMLYDTGYTGTIPEQMMRVMGFSQVEIEQRIRLLSATTAHRRVRGVDANARGDIIEKIESNAKLEGSAEGMVRDEPGGRIRHFAAPTTPLEQFRYLMIQQAITRHYWHKERHGGRAANVRVPGVVPAAV